MDKPTPITQTLQQRRALAHYVPMAEQAARDAELAQQEHRRANQLHAALQVDELLDRVRQSGTGECHRQDEAPAHLPTWRDVLGLYAADMAIGLLFAIGWGGVLVATWLHGPDLAGYVGAVLRVFGGAK
ncbi:MAG: hypothetical protein KGO96_14045 [Elusimicrobia bacterium]|nr:hypothetical protein [Elusimicrobiota bacterium]